MVNYWLDSDDIQGRVYIPKYYNPGIQSELAELKTSHHLYKIQYLIDTNMIELSTGHEIGKLAYGTGDIPFVRTSDITNWETKSSPKQGISEEIYLQYKEAQDIQVGDVLLVRDGTYLIGTNCIVTELDKKIVYQSHILKIRINPQFLNPYLFFLAINSPIFQKQIRSVQFTADTIDTIGNRFQELTLPITKDKKISNNMSKKVFESMNDRMLGKAFIKQAPVLIEEVLIKNSVQPIDEFISKSWTDILSEMTQDTVTSEFGEFETFWQNSDSIKDRIYLPKYYDPDIIDEIKSLQSTCDCYTIEQLCQQGVLEITSGDEIGKMAYGTGAIPFIRTSDFSNWELKHDPKQGISEEIYLEYSESQDVQEGDILLVRDGTYLIGTSCIVTEEDKKILFCGGLYKIRVIDSSVISKWLLLGLLNSYLVKRQIRTKQFTRDVIDTIGKRLFEIIVPIPKSKDVRNGLGDKVQSIIEGRIKARNNITLMSKSINTKKKANKA